MFHERLGEKSALNYDYESSSLLYITTTKLIVAISADRTDSGMTTEVINKKYSTTEFILFFPLTTA